VEIGLVRFENVGLRYGLGPEVLRDLSFHIEPNSFQFLTGPSGAGKTSLLRLLFLSLRPTRGLISIFGNDVVTLSKDELSALRRRIGIVFQDFRLLPNKTVAENVAFALEVTAAPGSTIRQRVPHLLTLVGLHEHAHHLPTQLSGGEQQRTAIARALVHDPAILIADEPTGNLDPVTSWEIIQLLIQINSLGTTVLMATHNQEIVNAMRRRVLALEGGHLVRDEAAAAYEREY
jgi:cell division transport system ATP-binding protein